MVDDSMFSALNNSFGFSTGDYWVDPDAGSVQNAIIVHCDFKQNQTCIRSGNSPTRKQSYIGNTGYVWVGEQIRGEEVR